MIRESEQMIVNAHVMGNADLEFLESLLWRLYDMRKGVRDIDDPHLHTARRSI